MCIWSRNSYTALFVIPGSAAFSAAMSRTRSKALSLSDLRSGGSAPSDQYLATVCLSMPCLLAMSLKFGFAPAPLYMFSSPMTFLSIRAPSEGLPYVESVFAFARLVKVRLREWRLFVSANGGMRLRDWLFLH